MPCPSGGGELGQIFAHVPAFAKEHRDDAHSSSTLRGKQRNGLLERGLHALEIRELDEKIPGELSSDVFEGLRPAGLARAVGEENDAVVQCSRINAKSGGGPRRCLAAGAASPG